MKLYSNQSIEVNYFLFILVYSLIYQLNWCYIFGGDEGSCVKWM